MTTTIPIHLDIPLEFLTGDDDMGISLKELKRLKLSVNAVVSLTATVTAAFDPEANLGAPTSTHAANSGSTFPDPNDGTVDTVFAMDVTGLDGSSGGRVLSLGGATSGASAGFRANGNFVVRAGSGASDGGGASWPATTSYVELAAGVIDGDGTLVIEFTTAGNTDDIRVWWNGELVGRSSVDGATRGISDAWGNAGSYYLSAAGLANPTGTDFVLTKPAFTTASDLRVYSGATVS